MPLSDIERRVTRLETQREASAKEHTEMWKLFEKHVDRIDSLEKTRDTLNGVRAALWLIAVAFAGILGALVHLMQSLAAATR